jgi:post-segregation antitoxin (ccd killing protein)
MRAVGLTLSQLSREHLEGVLKQHRATAWLKENAAAFAASNEFVERTGIWNEDERDW